MYFADLTPYNYFASGLDPSVELLNVGWLDTEHPYMVGDVPEAAQDRLFEWCYSTVNQTRGFHSCGFCRNSPTDVTRNSIRLRLGSAEIRVPGEGNIIYASPDLIYHYIT